MKVLKEEVFLDLRRMEPAEVLKELEKLTQLKALYLSGNQLTDLKDLENLTIRGE